MIVITFINYDFFRNNKIVDEKKRKRTKNYFIFIMTFKMDQMMS